MEHYVFAEAVKEKFRYLTERYGFSVVDERREDPEAYGNSLVRFESSVTHVTVTLDRGQALIDIGPLGIADSRFSLATIIEFLAPEAEEPAYIFPQEWDDYDAMIDWQVVRLASLLQKYCDSVLKGEFSQWKEMENFRKDEVEREYKALTGKDFPRPSKDPIKTDSKAAWDMVEAERERRVAEQRRSTSQAGPPTDQKKAESLIPWWAFWRRK